MAKAPEIVHKVADMLHRHGVNVGQVVFFQDGAWLYFDEEHESPTFPDEVDVGLLEDASDWVANHYELPVAFYCGVSRGEDDNG